MSAVAPRAPITFSLDAENIGWIVFDTPGAKANVFDLTALEALDDAVTAAETSGARGVVVIGAKDRIFIAGADLHVLAALPDAASAEALSRRGQELFNRIAQLPLPVVGAIHGACAGGGTELALACHWRLATDSNATQIGLPETAIGTIPGWGGCVRLPRLIGAAPAVEHILRGQLVRGNDALRVGIVDEVVPEGELRSRARAAILRFAGERPRRAVPAAVPDGYFVTVRQGTLAKTRGHVPAPLAALDVIERSAALLIDEALKIEAKEFGRVTTDKVCRNLIHVHFLREAARKRSLAGWFERPASVASPQALRKVGVVGAGVMGSGIAHWLASGGCEVVLRDVNADLVAHGVGVIQALLEEGVTRGQSSPAEAATVRQRIRTTIGWAEFADCDLVVEAIVEEIEAKRRLFAELATHVRPDALLASNTSALPIEAIAADVPNPGRTLGIHFFNPVSRMPLVELVLGKQTEAGPAQAALELVRRLRKAPVICRSSPGFLVTRVLFFYLNAAVRMWESGGATEAIDGALRKFGWPMGPLRLIDEVGIDVTAFIFGEMAHYFPGRFVATKACDRLLEVGLRGRKNGASQGFYRYAGRDESGNETDTRSLWTTASRSGAAGLAGEREPAPAPSVVPDEATITATLMAIMVAEAKQCLAEGVVLTSDDLDFALLSGAGFPAFRGGLLRWAAG